MFTKNIFNTKKDPIADLVAPILEAQTKSKMEELKGQQHKIDKNKNNKIDAHDFKILRGEKKAVKEESENLEEGLIGGGYSMKMKHSDKYRIHAPDGQHIGDVTKEPGAGKWRHHAGGSKWDGTETSPHYKTGVSNNIIDAAKKVAEIHKSSVNEAVSPFDWKNRPSELKTKPGEKAGFDSKKVSTGTVYTRKPPKPEKDDMKEEIDPNDTTVDTLKGREKTSDNPFLSKKVKMDVPDNVKEEVELDERTLTKGETAEKERIVKGMKKSLAGFKSRYGDRAKSVMYATATKAAKKD